MATVASLLVSLRAQTDDFQRGMRRARQEVQVTANIVNTLGRQIQTGLVAAFSIGAVANELRNIAQVGVQLQSLQASFRAITGSANASRSELAFVAQTADRLGFNVLALAEQYRGLAAAARGTTLEGAKQREIFVALSEAARVYGLSNEQLGNASLAVQQIIGKGVVQAEELRGQLSEALPGATQIAARALGITTAALGDLVKTGTLTAEDFLPKFAAQIRRELGGGAEDASRTAGAAFNRFQNDIVAVRDRLASSGLLDFLARAADALGRVASEAVGASRTVRQALADIDASIPNASESTRKRFADLAEEISILQSGAGEAPLGFSGAGASRAAAVREEIQRLRREQQALIEEAKQYQQAIRNAVDEGFTPPGPERVRPLVENLRKQVAAALHFPEGLNVFNLSETEKAKLALKELREANDKLIESITALPFPDAQAAAELLANEIGGLTSEQLKYQDVLDGAKQSKKDAVREEREELKAAREARTEYEQQIRRLTTLIESQKDFVAQQTLSTDAYEQHRFATDLASTAEAQFQANLFKGVDALQEEAKALFTQGQAASKARENIERLARVLEDQRDAALQVTLTADAYEKLRFQEELTGASEERYRAALGLTTEQLQEHILAARAVIETRKQLAELIDRQVAGLGGGENFTVELPSITPAEGLQRTLDLNLEISDALRQQILQYESVGQAIEKLRQNGGEKLKAFAGIFQEAFSSASDAIAGLVREGSLNFSRLIDSILADITRLALEQAILQPLGNAFSAGINAGTAQAGSSGGFNFGAAGGQFLTTLLGAFGGGSNAAVAGSAIQGFRDAGFTQGLAFASGGIMTNRGRLPLRRYQLGGIARTPQAAIFGENSTPEAFVPVPSGRIPVELRGAGDRTVNNNVNLIFPNVTNRQEAEGIRRSQNQISAQILQGITRSQARDNVNPTVGRR